MTKLEELIKELCPNGVKYINLVEVTEITREFSLIKKKWRRRVAILLLTGV